ncbi:glyoxal oxidase-related protein [Melia azedarach]|uniref:Glyoxal oxidase-related protein n=1 Tax=Melia azedarach TaxID=155640 RepID=A0ACC1XBE5_MELAZ|nr:glyoxal oxidase-related protein [Melia azedarach]
MDHVLEVVDIAEPEYKSEDDSNEFSGHSLKVVKRFGNNNPAAAQPGQPAKPAAPKRKRGPFLGKWELHSNNSGVSTMHAILLPKVNQIVMFDATIWRVSQIQLSPDKMPCRIDKLHNNQPDCWAHSVLYDVDTAKLKTLKVNTDTWCSSGGLTVDGNLVSTGGYQGGANTARYLSACDNCDWKEYPTALADRRWYATQVTLADGGFLVVGGRDVFSWEYIPPEGQSNKAANYFPLLKETCDYLQGNFGPVNSFRLENNLYPFVYLVPDGNVYIFANNRSILFDPKTDKVLREYPVIPGGPRSYPASAASALLPLKPNRANPNAVDAEVLICGGATYDSYMLGETKKPLPPALQDCGRMVITSPNPVWKMEMMPTRRVMGDAVNLPTGDVLIINGAKTGSAGWHDADDPNLNPVLYRPDAPDGRKFRELAPTNIARMYHSVAVLLQDGRVLIAGSNDNDGYLYNVKFPTELRVEKFSPTYLNPRFNKRKPQILADQSESVAGFGKTFQLKVKSNETIDEKDFKVTLYSPPFVTHSISMNQRLIVLDVTEVKNNVSPGVANIVAVAPPSGAVAPPGYYLLTAVHRGVPSHSVWFQVK